MSELVAVERFKLLTFCEIIFSLDIKNNNQNEVESNRGEKAAWSKKNQVVKAISSYYKTVFAFNDIM